MIYLLYQSPWPVGGSTSYTVHLKRVLGDNAEIIRIGKRTEHGLRQLSEFGVHYRIMALEDVIRLRGPIVLTASDPKMDENVWVTLGERKNWWTVFHDPNEFKLYKHWQHVNPDRVICIRTTGPRYLPKPRKAVFIPHPYEPVDVDWPARRRAHAVSIARTSSVKHSEWILEANRHLPAARRCTLYGELNRLWLAHYLRKHYPEVTEHPCGYPRAWGAAVRLCTTANYMVDLTVFKGDGGGTQYTLLEAINGGAVPVMSSAWCSYTGPARNFGPAVGSAAELQALLKRRIMLDELDAQRHRNERYLYRTHGVKTIREQYLWTLR